MGLWYSCERLLFGTGNRYDTRRMKGKDSSCTTMTVNAKYTTTTVTLHFPPRQTKHREWMHSFCAPQKKLYTSHRQCDFSRANHRNPLLVNGLYGSAAAGE